MEKLLISACLMGNNTKYNGKNNYKIEIEELRTKYEFIPICPEVMGGLEIPRPASEIVFGTDKVINKNHQDVTEEFHRGALIVKDLVLKYNIKKALLKDGSPSCGVHKIYDGSFTGNKIDGNGITTRYLKELGLEIYSEDEIYKL